MPFLTARRTPSAADELVLVLGRTAEVYAIIDVVLLGPAFEWCSRTFPTSFQKIGLVQGSVVLEAVA